MNREVGDAGLERELERLVAAAPLAGQMPSTYIVEVGEPLARFTR
jgi:hypothetical protein